MSTPRSAKWQNQGLIPAKVICHGQSKIEIIVFPEDQESPHSVSKIRIVSEGLLGEGAFGTVVHGKMMEEVQGQPGEYTNFKEVAVKCSRKKMRGKELDRLREEVKIMALLEHPNIVHFYLACVFYDFIYIVMEKCEKANLHDVIKEHESSMKMSDILFIGYQMVDAICYMHAKGCIHRDLKPTNFVFDRDGNIKLTDFGLSSSGNSGIIYDPSNANAHDHTKADSRVVSHHSTVAGTYSFMAPEIMKQVILHQQNKNLEKGFRYSVEVDIYSLGVVLFYLATKTSPYWNSIRDTKSDPSAKKDSTKLLCGAVSEGRWQWPHRSKVSMEEISYEFMRLVESMLTYEGSRRPELKAIRKHHIWTDRPESISDPLLQIIRKDRVVESRQATLSRERVEYKKQCLVKLQELESVGRERIQSLRNRYEQKVAIQLKELISRFTIISTSQSILNKLLSKQHDEGMQIVLDSNKHPEKSHQPDPRPRPMTDREVEVSGRHSFCASTLAVSSMDSPLATRARKSTPKTPASQTASPLGSSQVSRSSRAQRHGKSQAAQYRPTPVQRSPRSHSREVSSEKRCRTPSFWLDGPSEKFASAPEPTFDPTKDVIKCPKKHPMSLMHTFPALNKTTGGTNEYGWGFWCDLCHKEVPSLSKRNRMARLEASEDERTVAPDKNTLFYHCYCGYDLCKACGAKAIHKAMEKDTADSIFSRGI